MYTLCSAMNRFVCIGCGFSAVSKAAVCTVLQLCRLIISFVVDHTCRNANCLTSQEIQQTRDSMGELPSIAILITDDGSAVIQSGCRRLRCPCTNVELISTGWRARARILLWTRVADHQKHQPKDSISSLSNRIHTPRFSSSRSAYVSRTRFRPRESRPFVFT